MKIVIPDDYQDAIHKLDAFRLLAGHEVACKDHLAQPVVNTQHLGHRRMFRDT